MCVLWLSACADQAERAYATCVAQVKNSAQRASGVALAKSDKDQQVAAKAAELYAQFGLQQCQQIKKSCAKGGDQQVCEAFLTLYLQASE